MRGEAARARGQRNAARKIRISTYTDMGPGEDKAWKERRKKDLEGRIAALEKEIKSFDPAKAAAQVRGALDLDLRRAKLELEQHNLGGM